jgi:hypothetical protein
VELVAAPKGAAGDIMWGATALLATAAAAAAGDVVDEGVSIL